MRTLRDFDFVFDLAAGDSIEFWWIPYGQENMVFPLRVDALLLWRPTYFLLSSVWADGRPSGGLAGAAEYETLVGRQDKVSAGMSAQSMAHLIIVAFIIFGNVAFFSLVVGDTSIGRF